MSDTPDGTARTPQDNPVAYLIRLAKTRQLPTPETRRRIREEAGLTQADIAHAFGVNRPTVSRWENGDRVPTGAYAADYALLLRALATELDRKEAE